jgi:excisionase family DNA binding protein
VSYSRKWSRSPRDYAEHGAGKVAEERPDAWNPPPDGRLWLPEEAAAFLQVPRSLVMSLTRKNLPCVNVGRFVRFRKEALEQWARGGGSATKQGVRRGDH